MACMDIDYNSRINFRDEINYIPEKDPLVHAIVDPFDINYLLAFHTRKVFIINIKN